MAAERALEFLDDLRERPASASIFSNAAFPLFSMSASAGFDSCAYSASCSLVRAFFLSRLGLGSKCLSYQLRQSISNFNSTNKMATYLFVFVNLTMLPLFTALWWLIFAVLLIFGRRLRLLSSLASTFNWLERFIDWRLHLSLLVLILNRINEQRGHIFTQLLPYQPC